MSETPIFVIYWKEGDKNTAYVFDLEENVVGGPGAFADLRDEFNPQGHLIEECLPEEKWDALLATLSKE